ncbi:peptidoglycan glycosyltransferase [Microbacteriaceae bacterium SG_E_30_P1]|uniref:Peptidoglycan glycosyltransferase n=1 Tax=Antiquaquibacter oligotrophicus TaxID=2880260 RepID=A0ABT6KQR5_9MICO|nr:penicillin-binding transpeptidase domain-containing protein [Antiquaquibacter oligotrophicus]MDH6182324.1 peptidoglycan glycosyltransferase [Antiquaquibacter oligotrophicus]UDF12023.1 penicillin-binding protein 2 [Antiquaquibacter oligotrophicus]
MNKELKRVSIVVLAMFLALFTSTMLIQVITSDSLRADDRNSRTLYDSYSAERGPILVDGQPIAVSVPTDDEYKFQRTYTNPLLYAPVTGYFTLNQGNTGIEGALNDYLSGTSNSQFLDQINAILTGQNPKGASVELTIDGAVQQAAWDALGDQTGAVIAMRPKTGEIIAMVSKPTYDPNLLAVHNSEGVIATYEALLADPAGPLFNRTISGDLNPPGSTFKLVVAAAALESGRFTPESEFPNPAQLQLPQSSNVITNSGGDVCGGTATVSLARALSLSCNIPFAELGLELDGQVIRDQANKFGFNEEIATPLVAAASTYPRALDDPQTMLSAFGQSDVRASPLQMAMVSSAIANGGSLMRPNLVERIVAPDLRVIEQFEPEEFRRSTSEQTAASVTQMMVDSVANGAASNARIDGVDVAGKTGTAENGSDEPYTLWFTGFAPANDPQVAVAVVVENGGGLGQSGSGNQIAAPIAQRVLEAVLFR